uniref:Transposase MuDR plant domain-containing protein n=1 Tax=Lactuca sativa TaxID=4236 RepID=A0A9R1UYG2_LACSA|nr:hypothetical protein LSAT_V11C700353720 [Lactuca sativa]
MCYPLLNVIVVGFPKYFTFKIHYNGLFTKPPCRKYIDGIVSHVDCIYKNLFSVHDFDDMTFYYNYCIPNFPLDYGLMPLGNDSDVLKVVMIEELELETVLPKFRRRKPRKRDIGSYSRKLELNKCLCDGNLVTLSQMEIEVGGVHNMIEIDQDVDKSVPITTQVDQGFQDEQEVSYHVVCNFQNPEGTGFEDGGGVQSNMVDDYESFQEDYLTLSEFDVEYNVQGERKKDGENFFAYANGEDSEDNEDIDDSCYGTGKGSEVNDDSDFNVDDPNLYYDVDVDMSWGNNVDEELEVVNTDGYEFIGFYEYEIKLMFKELSMSNKCSHGEIHKKVVRVGQVFKTKKYRALYFAKNDKIKIQVKCEGVVGKSGQNSGDLSTSIKVKCKGNIVIDKKKISRSCEDENWIVKTINKDHKFLQTRSIFGKQYPSTNSSESMNSIERFTRRSNQEIGDWDVATKTDGLLSAYVLELQNSNPGSTIKIDMYPEPSLAFTTRTFRRIYECLQALKLGFQGGLRDLLGVNGIFMKGPYPRQVLTVVGEEMNQPTKLSKKYVTVTCEKCHNKGNSSRTCKGQGVLINHHKLE